MPQQAWQHTLQLLLLFFALRRLQGCLSQRQGGCMFALQLQHAHQPVACAGVAALRVHGLCRLPVPGFFAGLAQLHQQPATAALQPGIGAGTLRQLLHQCRSIHRFRVQSLAADLHGEIGVHIFTALEGARSRGEWHAFIAKNAQVGQHKLRPVLAQIAKEHEPEALAQRACTVAKSPAGFCGLGVPLRIGACGQALRLQRLQPVLLALLRWQCLRAQDVLKLSAGVQIKQRGHVHVGIGLQPLQCQQGSCSLCGVANLVVLQLAGPEPWPAPHQHAHQQGLRGLRQGMELLQPGVLGGSQQVAVALADPVQRLAKVVQVIEAVRRNGSRRSGGRHERASSKKPKARLYRKTVIYGLRLSHSGWFATADIAASACCIA